MNRHGKESSLLGHWVFALLALVLAITSSCGSPRTVTAPSSTPAQSPDTTFAQGVHIPIDHVGMYKWESPVATTYDAPKSLAVEFRTQGDAEIVNVRGFPERVEGGIRMVITFEVLRFSGKPELIVLRAIGNSTGVEDGTP